jgi:hypothetical protein
VLNGQETTRLPVRSALFKQRTGGLVVRWVTTSEYPLLYVFARFLATSYERQRETWGDGVRGRRGVVVKMVELLVG